MQPPSSPLQKKQIKFARMLALLLSEAALLDLNVVMGECWRSPEQAKLNAEKGVGIEKSLHTLRLAVDLIILTPGGTIQDGPTYYRQLGEFWEDIGGAWGGRFRRRDWGHFSLPHNGLK